MARSKRSSASNTDVALRTGRVHVPKRSCQDHFSVIEPQINAEGVHMWPFDVSCPVDVLFMTEDGTAQSQNEPSWVLRDFVPLFGLGQLSYSGPASSLQRRRSGHRGQHALPPCGVSVFDSIDIAALFFEPDLIRCEGGSDSAEYLTPFLLQDSEFPHIVPAETGIPSQVLELMLRIRSELPPLSPRGRLAVKTYLKMILMLLVNRYASYTGTVETFQRQQRDLDRLLPLFRFLGENCGTAMQVREASRICGMSESHFMSFFKRVTGLSFMKYLNHYRVERSQVMLVNTDEPMATISQEMGFCDQSYFGTVFRRLVGMTPAAYRRRYRTRNGSGRAQLSPAPPVWPARASLAGAPRPSTEVNRQLAALHDSQRLLRPNQQLAVLHGKPAIAQANSH